VFRARMKTPDSLETGSGLYMNNERWLTVAHHLTLPSWLPSFPSSFLPSLLPSFLASSLSLPSFPSLPFVFVAHTERSPVRTSLPSHLGHCNHEQPSPATKPSTNQQRPPISSHFASSHRRRLIPPSVLHGNTRPARLLPPILTLSLARAHPHKTLPLRHPGRHARPILSRNSKSAAAGAGYPSIGSSTLPCRSSSNYLTPTTKNAPCLPPLLPPPPRPTHLCPCDVNYYWQGNPPTAPRLPPNETPCLPASTTTSFPSFLPSFKKKKKEAALDVPRELTERTNASHPTSAGKFHRQGHTARGSQRRT